MKIAILTSDPQSIFWHRKDLVDDFVKHGHDVVILSSGEKDKDWKSIFKQQGLRYKEVRLKRTGINPFSDVQTFFDFKKILKQERPDKVFAYQAKAVVYGCWAAKKSGITEIYTMLTGLGSALRSNKKSLKNKIVSSILVKLYSNAFKCSKVVFFQNKDDRDLMIQKTSLSINKTQLTNGSGVDINKYSLTEQPNTSTFLYIGRLVRDKGVCEYLEACRIIKNKYKGVSCLLVGPFDTNPSAINVQDLKPYLDENIIEYAGEQKDVKPFISSCSTYILPSYHEGTPRSVLQAMAMGRSIITTDAPGCRETVVDGDNGFLVPVKNINAIVEKMEYLISNPDINKQMGKRSRDIAEEKYDVRKINKIIFDTMGLTY